MKKSILIIHLFILLSFITKAQTDQVATGTNVHLTSYQLLQQSFAQYPPSGDYDHYMHQCHTYRIIGLSLLGAGLVSSALALLETGSTNYKNGNANAAPALFIIGAAAGLTSIPFMILAHASKNKARLAASNQKTGFGPLAPGISKDITGISVSIPIGK